MICSRFLRNTTLILVVSVPPPAFTLTMPAFHTLCPLSCVVLSCIYQKGRAPRRETRPYKCYMLKLSFIAATMRITNIAAKTMRVTPTMPVTPDESSVNLLLSYEYRTISSSYSGSPPFSLWTFRAVTWQFSSVVSMPFGLAFPEFDGIHLQITPQMPNFAQVGVVIVAMVVLSPGSRFTPQFCNPTFWLVSEHVTIPFKDSLYMLSTLVPLQSGLQFGINMTFVLASAELGGLFDIDYSMKTQAINLCTDRWLPFSVIQSFNWCRNKS